MQFGARPEPPWCSGLPSAYLCSASKPVSGALFLLLSPAHKPRPEDGPGPAMCMLARGPACVSVRIKILPCICKKNGELDGEQVPPRKGSKHSRVHASSFTSLTARNKPEQGRGCHAQTRGGPIPGKDVGCVPPGTQCQQPQSHPAGNAPRGVLVNTGGTSKWVLGVGQSGCLTV